MRGDGLDPGEVWGEGGCCPSGGSRICFEGEGGCVLSEMNQDDIGGLEKRDLQYLHHHHLPLHKVFHPLQRHDPALEIHLYLEKNKLPEFENNEQRFLDSYYLIY